jgi:hypothetical protein
MGLAVDGSRVALGTRKEVWMLRDAPDIAPQIEPAGMHDACFLPRSSHITGDIGIHEIAYAEAERHDSEAVHRDKELWIVSTRFSCLCTLDPNFSFVPRWRYRLSPLCRRGSLPSEWTGHRQWSSRLRHGGASATDVRDGWRADKAHGGCIIDVASGICRPWTVDAAFAALA